MKVVPMYNTTKIHIFPKLEYQDRSTLILSIEDAEALANNLLNAAQDLRKVEEDIAEFEGEDNEEI